jgi:hypothetical protein
MNVISGVLVIKILKMKLQGLAISVGLYVKHFKKSLGQKRKLSFTKP